MNAPHRMKAPTNGEAYEAAKSQTETFWAVQNRMMNIYGNFMTHWLERRQRAAQAALDATQRALANNNQPAKLPEIYKEWVDGSLQRISADIQEYQQCSSEIADTLQKSVPNWAGMMASQMGNGQRRSTRD